MHITIISIDNNSSNFAFQTSSHVRELSHIFLISHEFLLPVAVKEDFLGDNAKTERAALLQRLSLTLKQILYILFTAIYFGFDIFFEIEK